MNETHVCIVYRAILSSFKTAIGRFIFFKKKKKEKKKKKKEEGLFSIMDSLNEEVDSLNEEGSSLLVVGSMTASEAFLYGRSLPKRAGLLQCTANVCQNILGTGGLGMPAVFANAALGGGIFALLVIAAVASGTLLVLGWLTFVLDGRNIQDLITRTLGKRAAAVSRVLVLGFMWGASVLLLQIMGSNLSQLVMLSNVSAWYTSKDFVLSMLALFPLFPLSLLPSFERLSYFSGFGVVLVLYAFGFIVVEGAVFLSSNAPSVTVDWGFSVSLQFFLAFPTIIFSYMTHVSIVPMVAELERPTLLRVTLVVSFSLLLTTVLYLLVGVLGYLRSGSEAALFTNFLDFYPQHLPAAIAARACTVLQMVLGFPIGVMVGRMIFQQLLFKSRQWSFASNCLFSFLWIGSALIVATFVQKISYVLVFVGSSSPMAFVFIFPSAMLAKSFSSGWKYWVTRLICVVLSLTGVVFGVTAIVANFL